MARRPAAQKRPTNLSLNVDLLTEARELGINVSEVCERGLADEVQRARAEAWLTENREAIESSNAYVERRGLPLARYRLF